ncbi:MAG: ornithine cyclodeaminase family protein [Dehalococcoidia bacterium]|nr:ornithine cyclodeaminase family protein [Dehalococcoidia bacterium]
MLFLNNDDVRAVLTAEVTLDALRESYTQLFHGDAVCRPRIGVSIPTSNPENRFAWSSMDGGSAISGYFASRIKCDISYRAEYEGVVTHEKYSTQLGKFCGLIFLVKVENAEIVAIINDSALQRFRVGADGALGTDYVARKDAAVLGILGSGGMAHTQLACTLALRKNIRKVQIFSPTRDHREAFAKEIRDRYELEAVAVDSGEAVFKGADIIAGCTDGGFKGEENNAAIIGRWLEPGQHWTTIGGGPDKLALERTDFSLRFGNAPAPLGLPQWATAKEGIFYSVPSSHASGAGGEHEERIPGKTIYLADLLAGKVKGRTSDDQITFSERGNLQGAQFHAVAAKVYEAALSKGIGREVPTDWFLEDERN